MAAPASLIPSSSEVYETQSVFEKVHGSKSRRNFCRSSHWRRHRLTGLDHQLRWPCVTVLKASKQTERVAKDPKSRRRDQRKTLHSVWTGQNATTDHTMGVHTVQWANPSCMHALCWTCCTGQICKFSVKLRVVAESHCMKQTKANRTEAKATSKGAQNPSRRRLFHWILCDPALTSFSATKRSTRLAVGPWWSLLRCDWTNRPRFRRSFELWCWYAGNGHHPTLQERVCWNAANVRCCLFTARSRIEDPTP